MKSLLVKIFEWSIAGKSADELSYRLTREVEKSRPKLWRVTAYIKAGADVNVKDWCDTTVLMRSARAGHRDVVRALISHGAALNEKDDQDRTALRWAVICGRHDVVRILIAAGADLKIKTYGESILMAAVCFGTADIVRELLSAGARLDEKDEKGNTAFFLANRRGESGKDIARVLEEVQDRREKEYTIWAAAGMPVERPKNVKLLKLVGRKP